MTEQWLMADEWNELVNTGSVETDSGEIKLTDYVYSRVRKSNMEVDE